MTARAAVVGLLCLVVSARGAHAQETAAAPAATSGADRLAALMDEGSDIYGTNCSECHADGGVGRPLAANAALANRDAVVKQILLGSTNGDMSEFASTLSDRQIAAVATYIRNSWDNAFGIVVEMDVKQLREAVVERK